MPFPEPLFIIIVRIKANDTQMGLNGYNTDLLSLSLSLYGEFWTSADDSP